MHVILSEEKYEEFLSFLELENFLALKVLSHVRCVARRPLLPLTPAKDIF